MKNKTSLYLISVAFLLSSCSLGGKKGQENNEQNQNHNSTICTHVDSNNDHLCDSCNIKLTSHKDLDNDHFCDVCSFKMSSHLDDNFDHMCDVCNEKMSEHEDKNNDHLCDICNLKITEHVDENNDNYCDICKSKLEDDEEDDILNAPIPEKLSYRAGYENTKSVTKPTSGTTTIDLYGINDFHGAINADSYELGLAQIGSYMKSKTDKANTLFIDSGDTWQGSLESNYNYGNLITDVFSYAHLSARTIGNHDFDWGSRKLLNNTARSYNNYLIPTLGANIYNFDWDSKTVGDVQMYNLGKEYAIYTLDNGLRVGIVGVIGSDQITSISTNNVKSIAFTNHIEKINP